jgi:hypothetical protein
MRGLTIAVCLAVILPLGGSALAQQIYRTVDEDGNVVFTDVPPAPSEQGEAVDVAPMNTFSAPTIQASEPTGESTDSAEAIYRYLEITSPGNEESIRDNAGNVTVTAAIEPRLRRSHRMVLVMDQNPTEIVAEGGEFVLRNVDRGTHTVSVRVLDRAGVVQMESEARTFHMLRYRLPTPRPAPSN